MRDEAEKLAALRKAASEPPPTIPYRPLPSEPWQLTLRSTNQREFDRVRFCVERYAEGAGLSSAPLMDDDGHQLVLHGPRQRLLGVMALAAIESRTARIELAPSNRES